VLRSQGNYFIAFLVPAILMAIALILFLLGSKYYTRNMPTGNIFAQFLGATWAALRGKCKASKSDKREHFMDYAKDCGKYPTQIINDAKWVFPILVMYLPIPMFWALFDMQGSRWTQTATQMNGYLGSVQILPDQIQLLNSLMILLFLPIFQKLIYPAFEWCGVTVSPLRKMSLGQLIAAASFVISGFVQFAIQEGLTPIPDYNSENTLMVTNGVSRDIKVSSSYWIDNKLPGDDYENDLLLKQYCGATECTFDVNTTYTRTPTFDWFNEYNEHGNYELKIIDSKDSKEHRFIVNPAKSTKLLMGRSSDDSLACKMKDGTYGSNNCQKCADGIIQTKLYAITNVVFYEDENGKIDLYQFVSPKDKSGDLKIKLSYVNPTNYYMHVKLKTENKQVPFPLVESEKWKEPYASPLCSMTNGGAEFEPNVKGDAKDDYRFVIQLYNPSEITKGTEDIDKKDPEFLRKYETLIRDNLSKTAPAMICDETEVVDPKKIASGSIWTIMPQMKNSASCKTTYALDSNPNTLSVLYLIPQYVVITISEVLNSVTGLEFAYSQAPVSMKSTVQSFWLLTTCIGNVIVIFLVSVKIGNTQAGEYFILACIMAGAAFLFMLLSIFYYEYVDPEEFENAEDDNEKSSQKSIKEEDVDSGVDEEKTDEKNNSETTDF